MVSWSTSLWCRAGSSRRADRNGCAAAATHAASIYAVAGVRGEGVAHDLFLDGTVAGEARVTRTPWVAQTTWGVGVATRVATVEFRAQRRSAEYREAPGGHPYSTIEITWRP